MSSYGELGVPLDGHVRGFRRAHVDTWVTTCLALASSYVCNMCFLPLPSQCPLHGYALWLLYMVCRASDSMARCCERLDSGRRMACLAGEFLHWWQCQQ